MLPENGVDRRGVVTAGVVDGVVIRTSLTSSTAEGSGVDGRLFFERPGKSGTRTVTSDRWSSRLGSGVVVVGGALVVVEGVVDVVGGAAVDVALATSATAMDDVVDLVVVVVVAVATDVA